MTTLILLKLSLRYDNDHNNNDVVVIIPAGGRHKGNEGEICGADGRDDDDRDNDDGYNDDN